LNDFFVEYFVHVFCLISLILLLFKLFLLLSALIFRVMSSYIINLLKVLNLKKKKKNWWRACVQERPNTSDKEPRVNYSTWWFVSSTMDLRPNKLLYHVIWVIN